MTCSAVSTQFTNVTGGRTVRTADVPYSHTMIYKYCAIIIIIIIIIIFNQYLTERSHNKLPRRTRLSRRPE